MRRLIGALACAAILSLAPQAPLRGAAAAENSPTVPPRAPPSAKSLEYARRYVKAIRIDETVRLILESLGPSLVEAETAKRPDLTAADKKMLLDEITESMIAVMPRFTDLYAAELTAIFTEEELRQLAEFYDSPVGQSYISKMKIVSQASERAMTKLIPELTQEMEMRMCRRIDCAPRSSDRQAS